MRVLALFVGIYLVLAVTGMLSYAMTARDRKKIDSTLEAYGRLYQIPSTAIMDEIALRTSKAALKLEELGVRVVRGEHHIKGCLYPNAPQKWACSCNGTTIFDEHNYVWYCFCCQRPRSLAKDELCQTCNAHYDEEDVLGPRLRRDHEQMDFTDGFAVEDHDYF